MKKKMQTKTASSSARFLKENIALYRLKRGASASTNSFFNSSTFFSFEGGAGSILENISLEGKAFAFSPGCSNFHFTAATAISQVSRTSTEGSWRYFSRISRHSFVPIAPRASPAYVKRREDQRESRRNEERLVPTSWRTMLFESDSRDFSRTGMASGNWI